MKKTLTKEIQLETQVAAFLVRTFTKRVIVSMAEMALRWYALHIQQKMPTCFDNIQTAAGKYIYVERTLIRITRDHQMMHNSLSLVILASGGWALESDILSESRCPDL